MMSQDIIRQLQEWYIAQCDGDWEHQFRIRIETLDNPGWILVIDLTSTQVENQLFAPIEIERGEQDWVHCKIENAQFIGACGPLNLGELLSLFQDWINQQDK